MRRSKGGKGGGENREGARREEEGRPRERKEGEWGKILRKVSRFSVH